MSHSHSNTGVPGLTFSWKRAIGLSRVESQISRKTGVPFTRAGRERKIGRFFTHMIGWAIMAALAYGAATHPDIVASIVKTITGLIPKA